MKDNRFSMLCVAGLVVGTVYATAGATLPAAQTIRYKIRETPSNPASGVIFTIIVELTADQLDGDYVAWQTDRIRFVRISDGAEWIQEYGVGWQPNLWWVAHADPQYPQVAEFALPPLLAGTANAVNPSDPDLIYDFEGVPRSPASYGLFGGNVGALNVMLLSAGSPEPEVVDDDEPVEIDEGGDPI